MKITDIKTFIVHPTSQKNWLLVKVETDEGLYGWGESYTQVDRDKAIEAHIQAMKRYPTFDVLILLGTMILPWLAAIPVFMAGYSLDGNYLSADVIIKSFIAVVPFVAVSIVVGLAWNPVAWIACAATFYSLFAFFSIPKS